MAPRRTGLRGQEHQAHIRRDGQHIEMPQLGLADAGPVHEQAVRTLLVFDPVRIILEGEDRVQRRHPVALDHHFGDRRGTDPRLATEGKRLERTVAPPQHQPRLHGRAAIM